MNVTTSVDGNKAVLTVEGKLTVQTAPELEAAVGQLADDVADIDIDLTEVDYVSSAGLRVFVATDKLATRRNGTMRLISPTDEVTDVLEMTGLSEVLSIVR